MSRPDADDWIEAESEELASHDRLNTYMWVKISDLAPGTKVYNCRPVYKEKINPETLKWKDIRPDSPSEHSSTL